MYTSNYVLASGDFCCLLIALANSLDPDQVRQNVSPDLDPNHTWIQRGEPGGPDRRKNCKCNRSIRPLSPGTTLDPPLEII